MFFEIYDHLRDIGLLQIVNNLVVKKIGDCLVSLVSFEYLL